jgi:hypothetical protein
MDRLLLALAIMAAAAAVAEIVRRRRRSDPPTQPRRELPSQLDRADFVGAGWLVAVFTSDTCSTCADVVRKADVLRSDHVEVSVVSFQQRPDLHERYGIDAVPCLVVADPDGVVHDGFLGPVTATDLWASVANAREPGSIDRSDGCGNH